MKKVVLVSFTLRRPMPAALRPLAVVVAAALSLAGCAQTPPASVTPSASPTIITTLDPSPSVLPTPTASATPSQTADAGAQLAFVVGVDPAGATVGLDPVEMLIGDEAVAAAKEDGSPVVEIGPDGEEFIPNDYYLRNPEVEEVVYPLAPDALILLMPTEGGSEPTRTASPADLADLDAERPRLVSVTFDPAGEVVTSVTEFYLP